MRSRWGDAVYSTVYLWVRAVVVFGLPAAAAVVVGVLLIRHGAVITGGALFATGVTGLALAYLLIQTARAVLTVVLYRFAVGTVQTRFRPTSRSRTASPVEPFSVASRRD